MEQRWNVISDAIDKISDMSNTPSCFEMDSTSSFAIHLAAKMKDLPKGVKDNLEKQMLDMVYDARENLN